MSYIGMNKIGGMYLGDTKIAKAYLGDNLVYGAEPPDPTLIAYWNGADAAVSKNWSDRIGNKRWKIYDTYTKGTNYYQFNNVGSINQFATLTDNDFGVNYEIKVVVDFELNPDGTNNMIVFDFGGYGVTASGNWGFCAYRQGSSGKWFAVPKYNGNNLVSCTASGTPPVMETGTWTAGTVEAGIELNETEDMQRVYLKIGEYSLVSDWKSKIKLKAFAAAGNNARLATTCVGIGSTAYSRSRVRIKSIKVFNEV